MKEKIKIFILLICLSNYSQNLKIFDKEILTNKTKLNLILTKKRGIETEKKEIYFIENDNQTISAYYNGKLKWKTNVINECQKPSVGKFEIRVIELRNNKIFVTFGKHSFAAINEVV